MKYICSEYQGKLYLRGKCCRNENYQDWECIDVDFNARNLFLDDNGRPIHRVIDGKVVREPLPKSKEELKAEKEKKDKEDYIEALPDLVRCMTKEIEDLKAEIAKIKT